MHDKGIVMTKVWTKIFKYMYILLCFIHVMYVLMYYYNKIITKTMQLSICYKMCINKKLLLDE